MRVVNVARGALSLILGLIILSCGKGSTVKIGVIVPSAGSLADYGFQINSGIELAEKTLASKSYKNRYEIFYEHESDDPNKTEVAIESFHRLKKKGVRAIIGAASSSATLALAPLANESRIILLSPASSSPEINRESDFVFRNYPSDTLEAQYLSNMMFSRCKFSRVLMVRAKNAYAEGITYELLSFARKISLNLPDRVVKFESDPATVDFAAVVQQIVEIAPEAVFLGGYYDTLIPLIKEIRARAELQNLYIFTSSSFLPAKLTKALGAEMIENILFTQYTWGIANEETRQNFVKEFEATYHTPPNIYAAAGFDALMILAHNFEKVNPRIPGEIRMQLNKEAYQGVLGETMFNKRGDVTRIPELMWMKGGVAVKVSDEDIELIKRSILLKLE
jgi:branched-chain amino acid transport system substrate-binding protein